ncbi:hypothetical protein Ac2012v2_007091 [Leucoagaricus gongylophorus]
MSYNHPHTSQPQPVPGMTLRHCGNLNAKNLPVSEHGRDWSNGLCDCSGTCFRACFCPCVVYAQNKHRYEHMKSNLAPHPENGGSCCSGDCMLHAFISVIVGGWLLQCMQRDNIRQRYKIKGGCWSDCCTALCCTPCELAQESKELELEEKTWNY